MSGPATALLRALLAREPAEQHRIMLSNWCSVDWQSLTFSGERHDAGFVVHGDDALDVATRWTKDLATAEIPIGRGHFVADITVPSTLKVSEDGSVLVELQALTLCE